MRHRRWVIFVILLLILLPPLAVVSVRVASEQPGFREAVLARIMPDVGADLSVGDLSLGLASLTMSDIVVDLGDRGQVRVPRASIDISIRKLLTNGFDIGGAVSSILIDSPTAELVFTGSRSDSLGRPSASALDDAFPDYLAVSDGALVFSDTEGGSLRASSIDALIERTKSGEVAGSFSADLLGGEGNLTGDVASGEAGMSVDLAVTGAALGPDLPALPAGGVRFRHGRLSLFASARFDTGGPALTMSGTVEDAAAEIATPRAELRGLDAEFAVRGGVVTLRRLDADWDGAGVELDGRIDIVESRFEAFRATLNDVPIERVLASAGIESLGATGTADLVVLLDGPVAQPVLDVTVARADGVAGDVAFDALSGTATVRDGIVSLDGITASVFGGTAMLSGAFAEDETELELTGRATGLDAAALAARLGAIGASGRVDLRDLRVRLSGPVMEGEALVAWDDVRIGDLAPGQGAGGAMLADDRLAVTVESTTRGWRASGEVDLDDDPPTIAFALTLDSLAIDSLVVVPPLARGVVVDGDVRLKGGADTLVVEGALRGTGPEFDIPFVLGGRADFVEPKASLDLEAQEAIVRGFGTTLSGRAEVASDGSIEGWLSMDGIGRIEGRLGAAPERPLSAGLVVSEAHLRDIAAVAFGVEPDEELDGYVFVSASASGTMAEPMMSGQIDVAGARVGGVGNLSASGAFRVSGDTLLVETLTVREGERTFLRGAGTAVFDGPLSLSIAGDGVPGRLLGGDALTRFDLTVGVGGTSRDPAIDGRVEAHEGRFMRVPFDDLVARVTGARGSVRLSPLALERDGVYRLTAEGVLPYSTPDDGEHELPDATLDVTVDGDPIALLIEAAGFGRSSGGRGTLSANLVGRPGAMIVANARVDATASSVWPSSVVEELNDVEIELEIVDGAVVRGLATGTIEGHTVSLESSRRRSTDGLLLPPLYVAGVDAGVLALRTDGDVRVSIPGLMSEGEFGRMEVRGREGGDEFLLAGAGDNATLLGEVEFSDLSFLYPFRSIGGNGHGADPILGAEWALTIRAGRNVWYRRSDADVKIIEGGALDFRGVPSDGSLCVRGRLESTRGTVTYLNRDFDVRSAFVDFPFFCESPRFFIEAETRVEDGTNVTLTMDSYEPALTFAGPGATLDESAITLSSDTPGDDSEEEILSRLQYGMGFELLEGEEQAALERRQALNVVGGQLSMRVVRPILAPVETRIRRNLKLDLVRIDVDFVEHFLAQLDQWRAQEGTAQYLPFLMQSRITLGKYLARDWLVSYIGTTGAYREDIAEQSLGLRHELGIEYEVSRNTSLSMRVVYDPVIQGWDRRLSIENRYAF